MPQASTLTIRMLTALSAPETSEHFLWLLRISHADLATPRRFVRGYRPIISRGLIYTPFPFQPQIAQDELDRPPRLTIRIGNVSRAVTADLETFDGSPTVDVEMVLQRSPSEVEFSLAGFKLKNAGYDKAVIQADLTIEDHWNEPLPDLRHTPTISPGAHRRG